MCHTEKPAVGGEGPAAAPGWQAGYGRLWRLRRVNADRDDVGIVILLVLYTDEA